MYEKVKEIKYSKRNSSVDALENFFDGTRNKLIFKYKGLKPKDNYCFLRDVNNNINSFNINKKVNKIFFDNKRNKNIKEREISKKINILENQLGQIQKQLFCNLLSEKHEKEEK